MNFVNCSCLIFWIRNVLTPPYNMLLFNNLLRFSMKLINLKQKYLHITELYVFIPQIFIVMFLLSMNFLISFKNCLTSKLSKYVKLSSLTYYATQWPPVDFSHQDLLHISDPVFKYFHDVIHFFI